MFLDYIVTAVITVDFKKNTLDPTKTIYYPVIVKCTIGEFIKSICKACTGFIFGPWTFGKYQLIQPIGRGKFQINTKESVSNLIKNDIDYVKLHENYDLGELNAYMDLYAADCAIERFMHDNKLQIVNN